MKGLNPGESMLWFLMMMMASAQAVETSVNTNNSPSQDYTTNLDDHSNHNNLGLVETNVPMTSK